MLDANLISSDTPDADDLLFMREELEVKGTGGKEEKCHRAGHNSDDSNHLGFTELV